MKCLVCKTMASWPRKSQFVLQDFERDPYQLLMFPNIESMAGALREGASPSLPSQEPRHFKNDVPGDIVWSPAENRVTEYERLSSDEVRELARLLQQ